MTIQKQPLLSSLEKKTTLQKLEEQIYLEEHTNRYRVKIGDFIKTPLPM